MVGQFVSLWFPEQLGHGVMTLRDSRALRSSTESCSICKQRSEYTAILPAQPLNSRMAYR